MLNTGTKYGIDIKRVVIAGDSAGGNLAAAVTQTLAEVLELHCRKQVLAGQVGHMKNQTRKGVFDHIKKHTASRLVFDTAFETIWIYGVS